MEFSDDAIREIIHSFTREAGVRNLEREIATVTRKQARRIAEGNLDKMVVTPEIVREYLGVPKFRTEKEVEERVKKPGVAVGLVWTPVGGDIIFIEATRMRGGKQFTMTGSLGEVMQESMTAALTWVRANAERYGIDPGLLPQTRHPHPRAFRRGAEGRSIRRRRHGYRFGEFAHRAASTGSPGDDR